MGGWNRNYRYNFDNCVFYANSAFLGGALYLLADQDNDEDEDQDVVNTDGAGIVTFNRCGYDGSHEIRAVAGGKLRLAAAKYTKTQINAMYVAMQRIDQ